MHDFLKLSNEDKRLVITNTSLSMGVHEGIIEKDFWVCLLLDILFSDEHFSKNLIFKGGTCLSKCFGLINRFSEDIDLILNWELLGYSKDEPWLERSNTKQNLFNKEAIARGEAFISKCILPQLSIILNRTEYGEIKVQIDNQDKSCINIFYPKLFELNSILPVIRLEIGALAAWAPSLSKTLKPYIFEYFPKLEGSTKISVQASAVERTFWEKATILHYEANRPSNISMPQRYARHYYDFAQMINSEVKESAMSSSGLLIEVARFKQKFYPRGWAKYQDAKKGTLKLLPPSYRIPSLEKDYREMKAMLFGEIPSFVEILDTIETFELECNRC